MQAHTHQERTLLPRGLIGRQPKVFRLRLTQIVDFFGDAAIVIGRSKTAAGRELYEILTTCPERPVRHVLGNSLTPSSAPTDHPIHEIYFDYFQFDRSILSHFESQSPRGAGCA